MVSVLKIFRGHVAPHTPDRVDGAYYSRPVGRHDSACSPRTPAKKLGMAPTRTRFAPAAARARFPGHRPNPQEGDPRASSSPAVKPLATGTESHIPRRIRTVVIALVRWLRVGVIPWATRLPRDSIPRSELMENSFNPTIGNEPHHRDQDIHG